MANGSKNKDTQEVTVYNGNQFAVATRGVTEITEIIKETLGGEQLSPRDLERIKVPGLGGTSWEIPTFDGIEHSENLDGIIIHSEVNRAYWETEFDGGKTPPNCSSFDCITGTGTPGGACASCPMDKFGSTLNPKSEGKACQEKRVTFILRADSMLPIVLYIPAASLDNAKTYLLMKLAARAIRPYNVVTRFSLEKDKSKSGITFSKVVLKSIGSVPDPEKIEAYVKSMKPALERAAKAATVETATGSSQETPNEAA